MGSVRRLIVVTGQEGVGKSTIIRALVRASGDAAQVDAEDLGQVEPCHYDEPFFELLRRNVAAIALNFWNAGYPTVVSGSYLRNASDWRAFLPLLGESAPETHIVHLVAEQAERDRRRVTRPKQTTSEWRDLVDRSVPEEDETFRASSREYGYTRIDSTRLTVEETVATITEAIPEAFRSGVR